MSNITTTFGGATITIDEKLFKSQIEELSNYLQEADVAMTHFKEAVEVVAETSGLSKAMVSKFAKTRFAQKLEATSEQAELFETLEGILV
jgi:primosomal protein N''